MKQSTVCNSQSTFEYIESKLKLSELAIQKLIKGFSSWSSWGDEIQIAPEIRLLVFVWRPFYRHDRHLMVCVTVYFIAYMHWPGEGSRFISVLGGRAQLYWDCLELCSSAAEIRWPGKQSASFDVLPVSLGSVHGGHLEWKVFCWQADWNPRDVSFISLLHIFANMWFWKFGCYRIWLTCLQLYSGYL